MPKRKIPEHQLKRIREISLFIKSYRTNECLSQTEFSEITSNHINTIQRFEAGDKNFSILTLFNCIDGMGLSLSQFFEGME